MDPWRLFFRGVFWSQIKSLNNNERQIFSSKSFDGCFSILHLPHHNSPGHNVCRVFTLAVASLSRPVTQSERKAEREKAEKGSTLGSALNGVFLLWPVPNYNHQSTRLVATAQKSHRVQTQKLLEWVVSATGPPCLIPTSVRNFNQQLKKFTLSQGTKEVGETVSTIRKHLKDPSNAPFTTSWYGSLGS